jgi:hypothetical protein
MPRIRGFRGPLQFRHARFDIFDFDRLGCVTDDDFGGSHASGCRRVRVQHQLHKDRSGGRRALAWQLVWRHAAARGGCPRLHRSAATYREPAKANSAAYLWYVATTLNNFGGLYCDTKRLKVIAANPPCLSIRFTLDAQLFHLVEKSLVIQFQALRRMLSIPMRCVPGS